MLAVLIVMCNNTTSANDRSGNARWNTLHDAYLSASQDIPTQEDSSCDRRSLKILSMSESSIVAIRRSTFVLLHEEFFFA